MEVLYRLWDSWEADAVVMDVDGNRFADPDKVHAIDFEGQWFNVAGPLNIDRCPQGKPLIVQAGQSPRGQAFAARHAEAVFCIQPEVAGMKRYYDSLKGQLAGHGRSTDSLKIFYAMQPIVGKQNPSHKQKPICTMRCWTRKPDSRLCLVTSALIFPR